MAGFGIFAICRQTPQQVRGLSDESPCQIYSGICLRFARKKHCFSTPCARAEVKMSIKTRLWIFDGLEGEFWVFCYLLTGLATGVGTIE